MGYGIEICPFCMKLYIGHPDDGCKPEHAVKYWRKRSMDKADTFPGIKKALLRAQAKLREKNRKATAR